MDQLICRIWHSASCIIMEREEWAAKWTGPALAGLGRGYDNPCVMECDVNSHVKIIISPVESILYLGWEWDNGVAANTDIIRTARLSSSKLQL